MKKILIVDDEIEIQKVFGAFFKNQGHTDIHFANDGLEAYALCSQFQFDLISLDHQMPVMTGANFLSALRKKQNINQITPVFLISAFIPDIEDSLQAFEDTFFFDKPVDFDKISKYMKILFDKKAIEEKAG